MMNGDVYDDDSVDDKDDKIIDYDDNDYNEVMQCSLVFSTTYYRTINITSLNGKLSYYLYNIINSHIISLISTQKRLYHNKSWAFKLNPNFLAFFFFCFLSFEPRKYIYICMYVCMNACTIVCMYVCLCLCMFICMFACMYICILNLVVSYLLNISIFPSTLCYLHWSN